MTQTNLSRFANPYLASETDVLGITAQIQRLETDDQLIECSRQDGYRSFGIGLS